MVQEYFRGVVWPRPPVEPDTAKGNASTEKPPYRYVIVGMLLSEKPIPALEQKNRYGISQTVLDGGVFGIGDLLSCVHRRDPKFSNFGDASNVLCSLDLLAGEE